VPTHLHALVREIGRIACSQPQRLATATTIDYGTTACCGGAQVVADNGNGIRTDATQVTADVDAVMGDDCANHYRMFSPGIVAEDGQETTGIMIADPDGHARLLESTRRP